MRRLFAACLRSLSEKTALAFLVRTPGIARMKLVACYRTLRLSVKKFFLARSSTIWPAKRIAGNVRSHLRRVLRQECESEQGLLATSDFQVQKISSAK